MSFFTMCVLAAGIGMALGTLGTGIGQGLAVKSAVEGVSRNPGASGKILTTMMIGLAMIESLAIYALVVCLIIHVQQKRASHRMPFSVPLTFQPCFYQAVRR
jgi:F-type H+-transporting ATPase subunit c